MIDPHVVERGNRTPEVILEDELHWQARFSDLVAHFFGLTQRSACEAVRWSEYFVAGLEVPRCTGCLLARGLITQSEARGLDGDR